MKPVFVIPAKAGIHSPIRPRTSISDTYKFLDSRFRGNDNILLVHHNLKKHFFKYKELICVNLF